MQRMEEISKDALEWIQIWVWSKYENQVQLRLTLQKDSLLTLCMIGIRNKMSFMKKHFVLTLNRCWMGSMERYLHMVKQEQGMLYLFMILVC